MRKRLVLAMLIAISQCVLIAQAPGTGAYAHASFDTPGFDSINLGNLNVRFNIPIVSRQGRGLPFNYSLQYEGLVWENVSGTWVPAPNWGFIGMLNGLSVAGYVTSDMSYFHCPAGDRNDPATQTPRYSNYVYHDPFGGKHSLNYFFMGDCPGSWDAYSTGDGSTNDGSGYTMLSRTSVKNQRGDVISPAFSATGQDIS